MTVTAPPTPDVERAELGSVEPIRALLDRLLAEQQDLSAVERFARRHDGGDVPHQARYYRDLLPAAPPRAGEQYAFEVDLDACSGCKACVTACHTLNGLDPDETWRSVGLLVGRRSVELPILQHVTTACHHCVEPACMHGCPVLAYEKDPTTGIVRHLDDQCIGCQYCILKCPYDVPKYNKRLGIVRKCDMCTGRLAVGEAPACVQGCPNQAIRIRIVSQDEVRERAVQTGQFLPGAHDPDYTLPTTAYRSASPLPDGMASSDHHRATPEHAHLPLVIMLVLTQLSVGAFAVGQLLGWLTGEGALAVLRPMHAVVALGWGLVALGASVLHLGRPLYAFRAFLGLRTSWLSREIVAFGVFAKLAVLYAACTWLQPALLAPDLVNLLGSTVAVVGLVGVVCSVMIYHDTRRPFWHLRWTGPKFLLSTLLLGVATTLLTALVAAATSDHLAVPQALRGWGRTACAVMAVISSIKIAFGLLVFRHLRSGTHDPLARTAQLLAGPLLRPTLARLGTGLIGGVLLPLLAMGAFAATTSSAIDLSILIGAAFLLTLASELLERYLFFTAVVAPRMPGGIGQ